MLSRSGSAKLTHHHLLVVCVLAIGAVAAAPNDAEVDDDASAADASTPDATTPVDASTGAETSTAPVDATVTVAPDVGTPVVDSAIASDSASDDASEDAGLQYVTPDGALPPYDAGDIYSLLCVANPHETDLAYSSFPSPYADVAGCVAFNPNGEGHPNARTCLCNNCFALQQQCDALPGCQAIQACAFAKGCNSVDTCYLIQGLCASVINQWGNGSAPTALVDELNTCGSAATPACPAQ